MRSAHQFPRIILPSAFVGAALLAGPFAQAAEIKAQVDWELDGITGGASPHIDGPAYSGYVDVLGSDMDGPGNNIFYHTYGDVGGNFGSRVSGGGNFDIDGIFTYKETYVATSTMPTFTFEIIPGEISAEELYTDSGNTPLPAMLDMFARYEIDIRVNGSSIWDSSGQVQLTNTGTSSSFSGTSIGGTLSTTASSITYAWATPFTDTIALGTFAIGDTFLLEYDLRTLAGGNAAAIGCTTDRPGENKGVETANGIIIGEGPCGMAISRSGDPFSVSPNPSGGMGSVTGAVPAPEPATVAILAAGLAGLGAVRRRRR